MASRLLATAEDGFASERMGLQVAACRWRLAERLEGEAGALLRAAAATWLKDQAIADAERLVQTIAPWRRGAS
jgi:hypothetical protein